MCNGFFEDQPQRPDIQYGGSKPLRAQCPKHVYAIRPRHDKRGVDLISDVLPFGSCGTASRMQSVMQSVTQSVSAVHMML
ncbi:MAG: hypothetical protein DME62_16220 [Verrucomicrobia bacterium]|nr:MAG: hypothetical protein DME62_16220 [Verrucomicrobiota bacterium]